MRLGVYAGTFDPPTNGHLWVIKEGSQIFDEFHVVINPSLLKGPTFSATDRLRMLEKTDLPSNVHICPMNGLDIHEHVWNLGMGAEEITLVRGIRDGKDFEFETAIHNQCLRISPDVHYVFLMPPPDLKNISSSHVKKMVKERGLASIESLVPNSVTEIWSWSGNKRKDLDSIFETGTAGFDTPRPRIKFNQEADKVSELMRKHFDKLEKEGFIFLRNPITGPQVQRMLDPVPFNLVVSDNFHLMEINIDSVKPTGNRYVSESRSLGPIIVEANQVLKRIQLLDAPWIIIEGKHRWLDAKERGDKTITAWVGDQVDRDAVLARSPLSAS